MFAGSRQETVLSPVRRRAITTQVWNHAVWIARADRARANPNLPQDLIDLDDGTIWEWEPEPAGGGEPGYALADDHDWAWPREELERGHRLAEIRTLDHAELDRLREINLNPPEDDDL